MNILRNKSGFTLMELMIVLVIIVILAAAGVPYYKDHLERQKAAVGVTTLRMIADSAERYMAMRSDRLPNNFRLSLLDADIDRSKLIDGGRAYNDGNFTYKVESNNGDNAEAFAIRNTGEYTLVFSLGTDTGLSCTSTDRDFCSNKLGL